jgi:hypothetical protein
VFAWILLDVLLTDGRRFAGIITYFKFGRVPVFVNPSRIVFVVWICTDIAMTSVVNIFRIIFD